MEEVKLFKIHRVPNVEVEMYQITCGNTIVSNKTFATRKEAEKYINSRPWDLIFGLILIVNLENDNIKLVKKQVKNK